MRILALLFLAFTSYALNNTSSCVIFFGKLSLTLPYTIFQNGKVHLVSAIQHDPRLVKEAEKAAKDQRVQREIDHLVESIYLGNTAMGIFTIGNGYYEIRGSHGGRVYYKKEQLEGDVVRYTIVGKATKKGSANDQKVFRIMRDVFPDFPPPPKNVNVRTGK